jgi:hypothetical protein
MPTLVFFQVFSLSTCQKRAQGKKMAPNNNRAMTYQNDEKHFSKMIGYFVGVVKLDFIV